MLQVNSNSAALELARSVASYFRVSAKIANEIIAKSQAVVRQWPLIAGELRIPTKEQERMAPAFRLAG